ncbi:golgin subfamily A member 6-like protein 22 [Eurytemora carolleeae]|uniref:golgin subfamily A member 6-like protein 22 n=1 Tax=Eurytemora carolleeae TaxID=1294199 RepID=UPI000C76F695|nr:golgin subfamily A member 6-like protein 22 [Eurytemora carolleeae]|eukprot:XP_023338842.1 golgin subfamily A member 6-like protein 22 [Eurytemora affinis]
MELQNIRCVHCSNPTVVREVQNGENQGKRYVKCGNPKEPGCHKFFKWENQIQLSSDDVVCCSCGDVAIKQVVKKEGRNKGRVFYQCGKLKAFQCKFWKWEEQLEKGGEKNLEETSQEKPEEKKELENFQDVNIGAKNEEGKMQEEEDSYKLEVQESTDNEHTENIEEKAQIVVKEVMCKCDLIAVKQVVKKEGKNKGKIFFHCGNRGKRCSFWRWGTKQEQEQEKLHDREQELEEKQEQKLKNELEQEENKNGVDEVNPAQETKTTKRGKKRGSSEAEISTTRNKKKSI